MSIVQTSLKSKNYNALGIDEIADDISNLIEEVNILSAGGGSGTTAIVNITSAQILAAGTTPIELLPAPGVGLYYDVDRIILEYNHITTAYTTTSDFLTIRYSGDNFGVTINCIKSSVDSSAIISMTPNASTLIGEPVTSFYQLNGGITLETYDGDDPTTGNGTLRAIITYTVRTFGS